MDLFVDAGSFCGCCGFGFVLIGVCLCLFVVLVCDVGLCLFCIGIVSLLFLF